MTETISKTQFKLKATYTIIFIVIAALVAYWIYLSRPESTKNQPIAIPIATAQTIKVPATPMPTTSPSTINSEEAAPEPVVTPSLPRLNESDNHVKTSLNLLYNDELLKLIAGEEIIRKVVRAVYQLSLGNVVKQFRPISSPTGKFISASISETKNKNKVYEVSPKNFDRYNQYINVIENISPEAAEKIYRVYSSLLEEAYQELGLGSGSFRETLIKAIDIAIITPDIPDDFTLIKPTVMYKFSNPDLEKLPSAQKLLIRMGRENRLKLITFLKEFKEQINN